MSDIKPEKADPRWDGSLLLLNPKTGPPHNLLSRLIINIEVMSVTTVANDDLELQ